MRFRRIATGAVLALGLMGVAAPAASIPEPSTVFYGKVIGANASQPFLLTDGEMVWRIAGPDGAELVLRTSLQPLNDGAFSYRINVPHVALSYGLEAPDSSVPLSTGVETHGLGVIEVDGELAEVLEPGQNWFDVSQAMRASTYRLDLAVGIEPLDSDEDGLPDWWEDMHGYNKHDPSDANLDLDGDGLGALAEYDDGSDPSRDSRSPELVSSSTRAYPNAWSGVYLHTSDLDTASDALVYTVLSLPENGDLFLVNNGEVSTLALGDEFTQTHVEQGALFVLVGDDTAFEIQVRDEDPEHSPDSGEVRVQVDTSALIEDSESGLASGVWIVDESGNPDVGATVANLTRSLGWIGWDLSGIHYPANLHASSMGAPSGATVFQQVIMGGVKSDALRGTNGPDWLVGGPGDDLLSGGEGPDRFIYLRADSGDDVIEDLNVGEGDVVDLTYALAESEGRLEAFVSIAHNGADAILVVDSLGGGNERDPFTITLKDLDVSLSSLYTLTESGALETGDHGLTPRISIADDPEDATENNAVAGRFVVTREGSVSQELTVNLGLAGSAIAGSDYASIPNLLTLPAGVDSALVEITPFADSVSEPDETVQLSIREGDGYILGDVVQSTLLIRDLKPSLSFEVLKRLAERSTESPAQILLRRDGLTDRAVFARLAIGGSAVAGVDYQSLSAFINLAPGQTTQLLEIQPIGGEGSPSLHVQIVEDRDYILNDPSSALLHIVDAALTFDAWLASRELDIDSLPVSEERSIDYLKELTNYALIDGPADYEIVDGRLVLSFTPRPAVTDVAFEVFHSFGLGPWSQDESVLESFAPDSGVSTDTRYYRTLQTLDENPSQFLKLYLKRP